MSDCKIRSGFFFVSTLSKIAFCIYLHTISIEKAMTAVYLCKFCSHSDLTTSDSSVFLCSTLEDHKAEVNICDRLAGRICAIRNILPFRPILLPPEGRLCAWEEQACCPGSVIAKQTKYVHHNTAHVPWVSYTSR